MSQYVLTSSDTPISRQGQSKPLAVTEGIILICLPPLATQLFSINLDSWPVHPYMYVTILLAAQYGVQGGLSSVLGGTLVTWLSGWPERPLEMDHQTFFMSVWGEPLSWLIGGLLVGIVTSTRASALRALNDDLVKSRMAESLIAKQYEVLVARTRKLEQSLAGLGSDPEITGKRHDKMKSVAKKSVRSTALPGSDAPGRA